MGFGGRAPPGPPCHLNRPQKWGLFKWHTLYMKFYFLLPPFPQHAAGGGLQFGRIVADGHNILGKGTLDPYKLFRGVWGHVAYVRRDISATGFKTFQIKPKICPRAHSVPWCAPTSKKIFECVFMLEVYPKIFLKSFYTLRALQESSTKPNLLKYSLFQLIETQFKKQIFIVGFQ